MSTYVLVHGAWVAAWAWERVVPQLERAGHMVVAPDLPAHGADTTPVPGASLQSYADRIITAMDALPGKVILVGHSAGGAVISQAAEARPEKVETLVYLSAYLLQNGQSILQVGSEDAESLVGPNLVVDEARGVASIRPEVLKEGFFTDCSDEDAAWGMAHVQAEPVAPLATPVAVSEGRFGRVPRVYVSTLHDRAVSPTLQRRMYTALPCQVVSLEAGHTSFLCAARAVAEILISVPQMVQVRV